MGRNFYSGKDYQFVRNERAASICCYDAEQILFHIYDEGQDTNLVNAYMAGLSDGKKSGEAKAKMEIRRALGIPEA